MCETFTLEIVHRAGIDVNPPPPARACLSPCPSDPPALIAALALERLGFSCIPLQPHSKIAALRWRRWQGERPSAALLRRWWRKNPTYGLAVVTGAVSGVVVIDVDGPQGQAALEGRHLPPTACARTPRGTHYYYRLPPGVTLRTRIGLLPHLDLLAEGQYCAVHNGDGRTWALTPEEAGIAPCPDWLLALAQEPAAAAPERPVEAPGDDREGIPPGVEEGRRHDTLTRFVGRLLAVGLSEGVIMARALAWAQTCTPPLPERETRAVVRSLAAKEAGKAPAARGVRIPRTLLRAEVSWGAKVLAATYAALMQTGQPRPRIAALAGMLGVSYSTVKRWRRELREAGLWEVLEVRPVRRYAVVRPDLLTNPALSVEVKATALALAALSTEGAAQVGQEALARHRGLSRRQTVAAHIRTLEEGGYLVSDRAAYCKRLGRRGRCNYYGFTAPPGQNGSLSAHISRPLRVCSVRGRSEVMYTPGRVARAPRREVTPPEVEISPAILAKLAYPVALALIQTHGEAAVLAYVQEHFRPKEKRAYGN